MIPNNHPRVTAAFASSMEGHTYTLPVIAWNEDGEAMIASPRGHLITATSEHDFIGLDVGQFPDSALAHVIPNTTGHTITWTHDGKSSTSTPIGWGFDVSGEMIPLDIDADGGYCGSLSTNAKLNDPTPQDRR